MTKSSPEDPTTLDQRGAVAIHSLRGDLSEVDLCCCEANVPKDGRPGPSDGPGVETDATLRVVGVVWWYGLTISTMLSRDEITDSQHPKFQQYEPLLTTTSYTLVVLVNHY